MSLAAPRLRAGPLLAPALLLALARLGLEAVRLGCGQGHVPPAQALGRSLLGSADLGAAALAAVLVARPLFRLPAAGVRLAAALGLTTLLALDAGTVTADLLIGGTWTRASVLGLVRDAHWLPRAPAWLSDPWHLAVALSSGLVLLVLGLMLARLLFEAWEASREAPGGRIALFVTAIGAGLWWSHRLAGG